VREGVELVPFDDAPLFHRILQDTLYRHGSTNWHPARFFERMIDELPSRDLLWAWGARYEEKIIAAGLFLHDDREIHFVSGASLPGYGSLPTSYLLHWQAIAQAAREGLAVFNSEASGVPSIDAFKETFNPVIERRGTLTWAPRPVWTAQRAYLKWHKGVRRLRSRASAA
jgi:lipid II:glycine glycyltransferase (peptidoglycan interpeptide bridge formation enzyme)